MPFTTLIDVATLAANLRTPDWVVLDCRFELGKPSAGEAAYANGHIEGAQYAHLDRDLAGPVGPTTGRHPLPDPEVFARTAARWGIGQDTQVVVYDHGMSFFAARAWWIFRWLGHAKVTVLDGGLAAWQGAGWPLDTQAVARPPQRFIARASADFITDVAHIEQLVRSGELTTGTRRLVDARGADRFAGENETIDPVGGHVPGAVNHHYARNYAPDGRLLSRDALRAAWQSTLAGVDPCNMVLMCGSGVSACVNLLALEHAGIQGARLYPGSWSEWVRDPSRPVTKGN